MLGNSESSTKVLDLEHELPSAQQNAQSSAAAQALRSSQGDAHKNDAAECLDRLARVQADFENARKRALREQEEFQEYALFDTAKALLPVLDSLEETLQLPISENAELRTAMELTQRQLVDVLFKMGVEPIHADSQPFDPRIHHAIATVDTDLVPDQTVVGELRCGYRFKNRLLRPAMVTVARKIPAEISQ